MEDQYPSNSRAQKLSKAPKSKAPERKKLEKVVTGGVTVKKPSLMSRFKTTFVGGDNKSVGDYILFDVLVPGTKTIIHDIVTSYVDRMLFPDSRPGSFRRDSRSSGPQPGRINYGGHTSTLRRDPRDDPRRMVSQTSRARHQFDEIVLEMRVEAEEILNRMADQIRDYGSVTVADLYDMLDITSEFTDNKWGWVDMAGCRIGYERGGYRLDLTQPVELS